jgi:uncharacterized membrane protein HdeD (DUF308 family)
MSTIYSEFSKVVRYWWLFLLSGSALIVFGILVLVMPVAAYATLTGFFIATFILNGLAEIGFGIVNRDAIRGWGWHVAGGIFDLAAGLLLLVVPVLAAVALPYFVGFWLLFRSISIIGRSFDLPAIVWQERMWMLLLGAAGLFFSFLILYNPALGGFTLIIWTALALLAIGLFYAFLGLHLRNAKNQRQKS